MGSAPGGPVCEPWQSASSPVLFPREEGESASRVHALTCVASGPTVCFPSVSFDPEISGLCSKGEGSGCSGGSSMVPLCLVSSVDGDEGGLAIEVSIGSVSPKVSMSPGVLPGEAQVDCMAVERGELMLQGLLASVSSSVQASR